MDEDIWKRSSQRAALEKLREQKRKEHQSAWQRNAFFGFLAVVISVVAWILVR